MESGGKGEERGRGRRERRHGRWSQLKARALDPEGGRAEKGIRSAEAAIISRHHYLYVLEIYANTISGKSAGQNGFRGSKRKQCIRLAMAWACFFLNIQHACPDLVFHFRYGIF